MESSYKQHDHDYKWRWHLQIESVIIMMLTYNCLLCFLHLITQYTDRPAAINRTTTRIIPPTALPTVFAPWDDSCNKISLINITNDPYNTCDDPVINIIINLPYLLYQYFHCPSRDLYKSFAQISTASH